MRYLSEAERHLLPPEIQKYGQLYTPNTNVWKVGDYVVHDDDRKELRMLMHVVKVIKDGIYHTKYSLPHEHPKSWRGIWKNPISKLHDPALFGIPLPRDRFDS